MAQHELFVSLEVPVEIKSKDVVLVVFRDKERFGELRVSKGAIVWRGHKDKSGRKLGWAKFDQVMQAEGRRAERRDPRSRVSVPKNRRS